MGYNGRETQSGPVMRSTMPNPVSPAQPTFNLFGPKFRAEAYAIYAQMREMAPVYRRVHRQDGRATCFFTRYEDAVAVLRDHRRLVKDVRNCLTPEERAQLPPEPELIRLLSHHMLNLDPPDHTRLRALVNKAFTARMVEQLSGRIQQLADRLLDRVQARGAMDLIQDFAFPLPIRVIAELLGIPARDRNRFRAWSSALVSPSTDSRRNAQKLARSRQSMEDFIHYLGQILEARRQEPQEDLITSLVQAEEAGDVLSQEELYSMILLLTVVGHETTVNLIGNGMLALLSHSSQLALLQEAPSLLPSAVEEMLRYDCPVERAPMRYAAEDLEIHGVQVRRGDAISVVLGSANRDPAIFPRPDRFDITRSPNRHLAFGLGIHYCLGAALARLEGRIAVETLLRRLPNLRLAAPVESLRWRTNPIMRGLQRLPVRWDT